MLKLYVMATTALQAAKNEEGQDLIEYALLGSLLAIACIVAITGVATKVIAAFNTIAAAL